ncbi:AAA family ATPase [Silvibacterium dinghuense]|nr:AAA family ATPase [Silvibacterium dinghuense]
MVIAVCLGADTVDRLNHAIKKRTWRSEVATFTSYISPDKRPYFAPLIKSAEICIAFVDFSRSTEEAIETAQYLTQMFAGKITVVALAKSKDPAKILVAMRSGCSEFLETPLQEVTLNDLFDRLERQWFSTHYKEPQSGSILSLFGVKGGVGTTTLAVHLAVFLSQMQGKRVLLVDHCQELGHVCVYLGMDGRKSQFQEVVKNFNRLDSQLLHGFIGRHPMGLDVLSSLDSCGARAMDGDALTKTLEFLRCEYDYIIFDCDIRQEEHNMPVIEASQRIYLVSTQDVGSLRNLSRYIDRFLLLDASAEKIEIALNRVSDLDPALVEQVEKAVKLPIKLRIPNAYLELAKTANLGEPIMPGTKSPLASRFAKWAEAIAGAPLSEVSAKRVKPLLSLWR